MAFTDRFIKLPIQIYDKKTKELTGNEIVEDLTVEEFENLLNNFHQ